MPDIKEKLVELMELNINYGLADILADRLIANGVTVGGEKCAVIEEYIESKIHEGGCDFTTKAAHDRAFQAVLDRLYNGLPLREWISVEERLPEPGTPCLGYTGSGCEVALYEGDDKWWTAYHNYSITSKRLFTHWMPLPEPPKGDAT